MSTTTTPESIRLLHVDDEPDFAEMAATFLERENDRFSIETATSASEGLDRLADSDFDCIVSDYDMPDQNGIEFLKTVREQHPDLPFILYTGKGSEEIASDAISAGVTDYLQKGRGPSQYTVLANRVSNAVEQRHAQSQLAEREKRLNLFFEQSPLGVIEWNENFDVVRLNDAAEEILGYSEAELSGRSWEAIVPDSDREPVEEIVSGLLDAEGGYLSINENTRKDGERIICEWHNRVVSDDDGDSVAIFSQFRDITEREERKRELERYEAYLEESTDIITVLDESGTIKYQSPSVSRILGYEQGELIGQDGFEFVHPDDRVKASATFAELVSEPGGTETIEVRFRTADGEWRWLEVRGTNRLDQDPINGIVTNNRDITDRKERELELREKERRYQAMFNDPNILVWLIDTDGIVLDINETAMDYIDAALDDLRGEPFWETPWFDHSERVQQEVHDRIDRAASGEYVGFEADLATPDGESHSVERIFRPVIDENGDVVSLLVSDRDITEHKDRERELEARTEDLAELTAQLDEQYRHLFEEAPVMAVVTRDEDGEPVIEECNQLFLETLGYDRSEVIGRDLEAFYTPRSTDTLLEEGGYKRALSGEFVREERGLVTADGETVETLLRAVPRRDIDGTSAGTLAMYIDITERKQLERETERLEEFASIVSHDLRNPLNVAEGRLEMAREAHESPHLDAIAKAHERMETLIEDLLTLAHEGDRVSETEPVALAEVVEICWRNVATGDAVVHTSVDRTIEADRSRLAQLLENLIRNAVEHGGDGVTVTVGELDDGTGFYVEDDGPGIPEDERDDVFEAGYSTTTEGTGFGLSIARQVAEAHDWEIDITDGTAGGARFEITGVEFVDE